jgi:hypothetical protein
VITGGLTVALPVLLEIWGKGVFSSFDLRFLRLLIYGLSIGVFSHLALDAITPEGIHVIPNVKMRLVPRLPFFSTGGPWEKLICAVLYIAIAIAFLYIFFGKAILKI